MVLNYQISSPETMERAICELGIVPFFTSAILGYSIKELTQPGFWFDGEEDSLGPWDWKIDCLQNGGIAYGKFLCGGKAAFATIPFYRELMNVRRATTTPDKNGERIMEYIEKQGSITIKEVRALLGVKKGQADAAIGKLMQQCRVVTVSRTRTDLQRLAGVVFLHARVVVRRLHHAPHRPQPRGVAGVFSRPHHEADGWNGHKEAGFESTEITIIT